MVCWVKHLNVSNLNSVFYFLINLLDIFIK